MSDPTADVVAIRELQARYGDVVTRRAWAELETLFSADARIALDLRTGPPLEIVGPVALGGFIAGAIERFDLFVFTIVNAVVELGGPDSATGRVYICEVRHDREAGRESKAYGLYRDDYAKVGDRWAIAGRRYSSLGRTSADEGRDLDAFPVPTD